MDHDNYSILASVCPVEHQEKLHMFLDFAEDVPHQEVPDPYYGGDSGFDQVFDLVESGSRALLSDIVEKHGL
jgi:protein-tyrosine phosphatase